MSLEILQNTMDSRWNQLQGPQPSEFAAFQRIRLKHINEMLGQLNQDATGIHLLMAEKKAIEEFLKEPA